jgi:hypothetical protein
VDADGCYCVAVTAAVTFRLGRLFHVRAEPVLGNGGEWGVCSAWTVPDVGSGDGGDGPGGGCWRRMDAAVAFRYPPEPAAQSPWASELGVAATALAGTLSETTVSSNRPGSDFFTICPSRRHCTIAAVS